MSAQLEVLDDPVAAVAGLLHGAATAEGSSGESAGPEMVVTGGSSVGEAYRQAAALGGDWSRARLWCSDERCVAPDDERSNFRLLTETLLNPLGAQAPRAERIRGEDGYERGAEQYEGLLRGAGSPRFSLVLLGLGPDCHLASMFPGQASLSEDQLLVLGVPEAGHEPFIPRVTLTLPALVNSDQVVFLVTGSGKASAVAKAFGPQVRPDPSVPASMLVARHDGVRVLLDAEAGAEL